MGSTTPRTEVFRFKVVTFCFLLFVAFPLHVAANGGDNGVADAIRLQFSNPRLKLAFVALQTWKQTAIFSDPHNFTSNWHGPDVCSYFGLFCAPAPENRCLTVVSSIDLNHGEIVGSLPAELGLLTDLALLHLNSNRLRGTVPISFGRLRLLYELDLSNNGFTGEFPQVVLSLSSLRYLDLRFNEFEGAIPPALFQRPLDAIFLNSNRFRHGIPATLGSSRASMVVLAENALGGCIPSSIGGMAAILNEIILLNNNLTGCIPAKVGMLHEVTVFDVGFNRLVGPLPANIVGLEKVEQLNVANNRLTGTIEAGMCQLPRLQNFSYSDNYFTRQSSACTGRKAVLKGERNCIPGLPNQRSEAECSSKSILSTDCRESKCYSMEPTYPETPLSLPSPSPPPLPKPRECFYRVRSGWYSPPSPARLWSKARRQYTPATPPYA